MIYYNHGHGPLTRPWLEALHERAGKITRKHQENLRRLLEETGREVTKVKKHVVKTSVTFDCKKKSFCVGGSISVWNSYGTKTKYISIYRLRSGGKNLHDTAAYPRSFGDHIARLHMAHMVPWILDLEYILAITFWLLPAINNLEFIWKSEADRSASSLQRVILEKLLQRGARRIFQKLQLVLNGLASVEVGDHMIYINIYIYRSCVHKLHGVHTLFLGPSSSSIPDSIVMDNLCYTAT